MFAFSIRRGLSVRSSLVAIFLASTVFAGCGSGDDGSSPTAVVVPPPGNSGGTITGKAVNSVSGDPVVGASVSAGSATSVTDATGSFTLTNTSVGERVVVRASAGTFAPGFKTVAVSAGSSGAVQIALVPQGAVVAINATTGGTASIAGTAAQITLPPNGVVLADGSAYSGSINVQLAAINPASNLSAMPGELLTARGGGTIPIESFGALSVVLTGAAGQNLNLGAGKTSTIRIPVASRTGSAEIPATIPLFYFNETSGLCIEEGSATLNATRTFYEGTVTHFSTWNADRAIDTITFTGCVADAAGNRISGAVVTSEGINYSGSSRTTSGANGVFTIPMKKSAFATIVGLSGSTFTNTLSAGSSATNIDASASCLIFGVASASLNIKLTWGALPSDVDSHLFLPNGSQVNFIQDGSLTTAPFAALDVDDVSSFGPEVITVRRLMIGTYRYAVNNYSGSFNPGLTGSPVRVELSRPNGLQVFTPPAGETASLDWWTVFSFTVDAACNVSVSTIGTWSDSPPAAAPNTTAVYCTPA
jgi:hypothetical protein